MVKNSNPVGPRMAKKQQRHVQVLEEAFSQVLLVAIMFEEKNSNSLSPGGLQQRNSEGVDEGRDRVEREQDSHAPPLPPIEVLLQLDHLISS